MRRVRNWEYVSWEEVPLKPRGQGRYLYKEILETIQKADMQRWIAMNLGSFPKGELEKLRSVVYGQYRYWDFKCMTRHRIVGVKDASGQVVRHDLIFYVLKYPKDSAPPIGG